jgi:hypothetical protein
MNFDDAIVAHSSWKNKLKLYLEKKDGSLNPAEIQTDQNARWGSGFTVKDSNGTPSLRSSH